MAGAWNWLAPPSLQFGGSRSAQSGNWCEAPGADRLQVSSLDVERILALLFTVSRQPQRVTVRGDRCHVFLTGVRPRPRSLSMS